MHTYAYCAQRKSMTICLAKPAAFPQDAALLAEVGHAGKVCPKIFEEHEQSTLWQYFPWLKN